MQEISLVRDDERGGAGTGTIAFFQHCRPLTATIADPVAALGVGTTEHLHRLAEIEVVDAAGFARQPMAQPGASDNEEHTAGEKDPVQSDMWQEKPGKKGDEGSDGDRSEVEGTGKELCQTGDHGNDQVEQEHGSVTASQVDHRQRWQGQRQAGREPGPGQCLTVPRRIAHIAAAVGSGVTIEDLSVGPGVGYANAVLLARHGRKVADDDHKIAVTIPAQKAQYRLPGVVAIDPLKPFVLKVLFMQGGDVLVQSIQIAKHLPNATVPIDVQ